MDVSGALHAIEGALHAIEGALNAIEGALNAIMRPLNAIPGALIAFPGVLLIKAPAAQGRSRTSIRLHHHLQQGPKAIYSKAPNRIFGSSRPKVRAKLQNRPLADNGNS